jgi:hypothetical protein
MVRASSRSEQLPSGKPHALEHKIRFTSLPKRYAFTAKKVRHKAGSGEERCAGVCRSRVLPGLGCIYKQDENAVPRRGKTDLVLINSMLSLSSGPPGRAQEPPEKAIPQQAIPEQEGSNGGD